MRSFDASSLRTIEASSGGRGQNLISPISPLTIFITTFWNASSDNPSRATKYPAIRDSSSVSLGVGSETNKGRSTARPVVLVINRFEGVEHVGSFIFLHPI